VLDAAALTPPPAATGAEAGEILRALAAPLGVDAVALYRVASDGALRLVAWSGYPEDGIRAWEAIPPGIDIPVTRAVVERRTIPIGSLAERARVFPGLRGVRAGSEATITAPVVDGDQVTGSMVLSWDSPRELDPERIAQAEVVARTAGPLLVRNAAAVNPELAWLRAVLEVLFEPWVLLDPVVGSDGALVDFDVVGVSGIVPGASRLLGRRLLAVWPGLASSGLLPHLRRIEAHGGAWDTIVPAATGLPLSAPRTRVRSVRVGHRIVLHWRPEG
jgi:hypothetical protein